MSLASRILLALVAASLFAAAPAAAVPCAERCRTFDAPGAGGAIVRGPDGNVWYAGSGTVGRVTPAGEVARFDAPTVATSDLEAGPDGGLWFTAAGGAVARVTPDGGLSSLLSPTRSAPAPPTTRATGGAGSMVTGPDGALWFTMSNPPALGRIGPDGSITEHALPGVQHPLGGLTAAPDGGLWFTVPNGRMVGRMSPTTGRVLTFRTSWNPYSIASGPSHTIWFAMTDSGRWTVTRMVPAGYMTFFQVGGPVQGLASGADDAIWMTRGGKVERLEPFQGAHPIRTRRLKVNQFAGSTSLRLLCPKYDLVLCAGTVTLTAAGRKIGSAPFSQRSFDAPATRILLNALGRRLTRRKREVKVMATLDQHDAVGTRRVAQHAFTLVNPRVGR